MGTNFYLVKPLSIKEKQEIIDDIVNDKYNSVRDKLPEEIHIGKRSGGWKFLWNANRFKYFEPNKESILEFLRSGNIYDEYGEFFTYDQFMEEEIGYYLDHGLDAKSYEEENNNREFSNHHSYMSSWERDMIREKNLDVNEQGEFYIDNFRFTVCDNFS